MSWGRTKISWPSSSCFKVQVRSIARSSCLPAVDSRSFGKPAAACGLWVGVSSMGVSPISGWGGGWGSCCLVSLRFVCPYASKKAVGEHRCVVCV